MFSTEISFGHSASQAVTLEQRPKPSMSIFATMANTRLRRSTSPWGSRARWEILAEVNNMAEEFGQAATHAPQPMQAAASNDLAAWSFSIGIALASWAWPV